MEIKEILEFLEKECLVGNAKPLRACYNLYMRQYNKLRKANGYRKD